MLDVELLLACACGAHSHGRGRACQPLLALVLARRGRLAAVPHDHGTNTAAATTHACTIFSTNIVAVLGADAGAVSAAEHTAANECDRGRSHVPMQRTHERGWRGWPLRTLERIPACVVLRICGLRRRSRGGRHALGIL